MESERLEDLINNEETFRSIPCRLDSIGKIMQIELGSLIVAIVTFIGFIVTVGSIVYYAGKLSQKIDSIGEQFAKHTAEDKHEFDSIYDRINDHGERIATVEAAGE